jgi:uncharacterized protein involved in cysteine biosynthesis
MIGDFLRALGQLGDRRFMGVFWRSILLTAALLAGFLVLWSFAVAAIPDTGLTLWGTELTALDWATGALAWIAGAAGALILMPAVAGMFIGLFLEDVADAVEAKHYPQLPKAGRIGFGEMLVDGVIFTAVLIVANLLALLIYPFSGPLAPFVFLGVNGYLLGRQYFELTAGRRLGAAEARRLRREAGPQLWFGGVLMALGLSIPLFNLAVPVLGVAAFTHTFHRVQGRR